MKLENQVCTPDQAKRLKELGVSQRSFFFFWSDYDGYGSPGVRIEKWNNGRQAECSIFTVAELGAMLPKRLKASWNHADTTGLGGTWQSSCNCRVEFAYDEKKMAYVVKYPLVVSSCNVNEAVARAEVIIFLLENRLIPVEEVNKRLVIA